MVQVLNDLADGAWLTHSRVRFVAGAVLAGTALSLAALLLTANGTVDISGRPLGTDFSNVWAAGRMALEGRAVEAYDWGLHHAVQKEAHGRPDIPFYGWHYPPLFLAVAAALALLPYLPALVVWQATTLAGALWLALRILPSLPGAALAAVAFPGVFICLTHGHNGFLSALLLGGGLLVLERRPVLAGVLFGLLAYKPQFGLLLPVVLVAGGHWRAVAAAAATVIATGLATIALFGWPVWTAFLASTALTRSVVLEGGGLDWAKMQSAFAWVRLWGGPVGLAYAVQGAVTMSVLGASLWLWRLPGAPAALRNAGVLLGALLSTPYVLDYDMVLLGLALAFVAAHGWREGFRPWEQSLIALAWLTPLVARAIAQVTLLPVGFLVVATLFFVVVRRAGEAAVIPGRSARTIEVRPGSTPA